MPSGGARPNTGPKRGRHPTTLTFTPGELEQLKRDAARIPDTKRLKNQLAHYATIVGQLATQYLPPKDTNDRPLRGPDGLLLWPEAAFDRFNRLMTLHAYLAGKGAPFQDPTFKAVALHVDVPQQQGDDAKVINLKIFEDTGTALGLMEVLEKDDGA